MTGNNLFLFVLENLWIIFLFFPAIYISSFDCFRVVHFATVDCRLLHLHPVISCLFFELFPILFSFYYRLLLRRHFLSLIMKLSPLSAFNDFILFSSPPSTSAFMVRPPLVSSASHSLHESKFLSVTLRLFLFYLFSYVSL